MILVTSFLFILLTNQLTQENIAMSGSDISYYLEKKGLLSRAAIETAKREAAAQKLSFCHYVIERQLVEAKNFAEGLARDFGLAIEELPVIVDEKTILLIEKCSELILKHWALPLNENEHAIVLAVVNPCDANTVPAFQFLLGKPIKTVIVQGDKFLSVIQKYIYLKTPLLSNDNEKATLSNIQLNEPLVDFINNILEDSIRKRASDIHIEPFPDEVRIRYRIDGLLHPIMSVPAALQHRIITRLKIMANLNIAEQRLPQDGHLTVDYRNITIDCRINICPVIYGEKAVIRILADKPVDINIHQLGLLHFQKKMVLRALQKSQGLIIITGPTGSGKTVTLYSLLKSLNAVHKNIISVEDPVEIQCDGVNQVSINPKIGFGFAECLRAFLRQDPDVIMIGEIRDHETAQIAVRAAETGHLVLSTLHTNNAIETVPRLVNLGVKATDIAGTLSLVVAQRLVRKLCIHHKPATLSCAHCTAGFQGRTGVFECITTDKNIAQQISHHQEIRTLTPFVSLERAAGRLLKRGITTAVEINRVIGYEL